MALFKDKSWLYGSGTLTGQYCAHVVQPVHVSSLMYRGFLVNVTLKSPASPFTVSTSVRVRSSMLGCLWHSRNFGDSMHMEQSFVGKVLSSWAILPPMAGALSARYTLKPVLARSRAA